METVFTLFDLKRLLTLLDARSAPSTSAQDRKSNVVSLDDEREKRAASVRLLDAVDSRPQGSGGAHRQLAGSDEQGGTPDGEE